MKSIIAASIAAVAIAAFGLEFSQASRAVKIASDLRRQLTVKEGEVASRIDALADVQSKLDEAQTTAKAQAERLAKADADSKFFRDKANALELATLTAPNQAVPYVPAVRSGDSIIFPKLLAKDGKELMKDAEFRSVFGRQLIFKHGEELQAFDVLAVAPDVLAQLGLTPDAALAEQTRLDRGNAAFAAGRRLGAGAILKTAAEQIEKDRELAHEAAVAAEHQRQQQLKEDLQIHAAQSDRIRANAAATAAEAARISALNP